MNRYFTIALFLCCLAVIGVLPAVAQAPADTAAAPVPAPVDTPAAAPPAKQPAAPVAATIPLVLYEKAKIVVDGEAEANGSIKFSFVPEGGKAVSFSVEVLKGTDKKDLAKAIYTQMTLAAGAKYKVKVSAAEVKIERAKKENAKFSVTVEETALPGVSVLVKKG